MIIILCTGAGRSHPINLVLLFAFTLCESYMITGFTCNPYRFPPKTVMLAGLVTALTTISLTVYAMTSKAPIQIFVGLLVITLLAALPVLIIGMIMRTKALHMVCCCFGVLIYGLYLIIDTRIITGREKHNGIALDHDDYVIGAMILYLDIIMMFLYILELMGDS
jgi:protein lifeguard